MHGLLPEPPRSRAGAHTLAPAKPRATLLQKAPHTLPTIGSGLQEYVQVFLESQAVGQRQIRERAGDALDLLSEDTRESGSDVATEAGRWRAAQPVGAAPPMEE